MQVWPLPRRQQYLQKLASGTDGIPPEGSVPVWFEDAVRYMSVYSVPLDMPAYRLANGRTRAAQAERIATGGLAKDFFTADPDSAQAMEAQEEILRAMVNEKGLLAYLKKNDQSQPLYLTPKGYVVNGNRRLCAMRVLVSQDEITYRHFKQVKVVILPTDEEEPIRKLEAKLQVEPDVRADYSWVALAMMRRGLREIGMADQQIAQLHNTKMAEIQKSIDMLDQAEAYLAWRGDPGKYSLIDHKMYAFDQLKKCRGKPTNSAARVEFATNVSYLMIDDPKGGRLYERIPDLFEHLDEVKERLKQRYPEPPTPVDEDDSRDRKLFGVEPDEEVEYDGLTATSNDPDRKDDVRLLVQDVLEEIDLRDRQRRDAEYCLRLVTKAHTDLQAALNALDGMSVTDGIPKQLDGIESAVGRIRDWLAENANA